MQGLTKSKLAEIRDTFSLLDDDKNGTISPQEIQSKFHMFDLHLTDSEIDELVSLLDKNGDGKIAFEGIIGNFVCFD